MMFPFNAPVHYPIHTASLGCSKPNFFFFQVKEFFQVSVKNYVLSAKCSTTSVKQLCICEI